MLRNPTYLQGTHYDADPGQTPLPQALHDLIHLKPQTGTVQRIYSTRVGQGIAILPSQHSLIDATTGLPLMEVDAAACHRWLWALGGLSVATLALWRAFK